MGEFWKKLFTEVVDTHILQKKARIRRTMLPWIRGKIWVLMRARNCHCKKARKTKRDEEVWYKWQ